MSAPPDVDPDQLLRAYRKSRFTIICHVVFLTVCVVITLSARSAMGLPPQVLTTVIIVALLVFGKDIMTFFRLRSEVARLRDRSDS